MSAYPSLLLHVSVLIFPGVVSRLLYPANLRFFYVQIWRPAIPYHCPGPITCKAIAMTALPSHKN